MSGTAWEFSAGGALLENGRTLLVLVKNLKGEKVWTFPKGHIERGETPEEAALREVFEETGCVCKIIKKLFCAEYFFTRNGSAVAKTVRWYLMKKTGGNGRPLTEEEILDLRWFPLKEAEKKVSYPSDFEILKFLAKERNEET